MNGRRLSCSLSVKDFAYFNVIEIQKCLSTIYFQKYIIIILYYLCPSKKKKPKLTLADLWKISAYFGAEIPNNFLVGGGGGTHENLKNY